ncbi:RNA methyltransferase [Niveibacterium sp. 24ML]|uniref:TrmH family RNA methyltransferase n=1 Tax=Niveibacterium sp. 24ML TaxID=2985512 RepID=UPI00226E7EAA|nr:RNA methyltransferase [Niveibacterium sp. 24ML]MCX9156570.1 RNA methyltransferase [Niveibacterium sp. 24ML]
MLKPITSRDNPLIKRLRKLAESSRARRSEGTALIEGVHLVTAALDAGRPLGELLVSESGSRAPEVQGLLDRARDVSAYLLPDALFALISAHETPVGVLATIGWGVAVAPPPEDADWLVLDGVQDAGNVGTLMRTAAAAGVACVLLGPGCAQAWGPKVLRAAMGAHFVLDLYEVDDLPGLLSGYAGQIAATRLDAAVSLYDCELVGPTAWLFGAEGQGLSPILAQMATRGVVIPMAPGIESLNVAAAAAICLFEQRRQRLWAR